MRYLIFLSCFFLIQCDSPSDKSPLFTNITTDTGIDFQNNLVFTEQLNPYTYRNFYNGAGVAIGDVNNDGLPDIYFAGNQVDNKLFLNNGNFAFKDITATAGVACPGVWSTGVTFVDINADGYLDIYVCKSGDPNTPNRHNELFINNGDLTFTEKSKEFGLDFVGLSVQAAFFDYDKDGDLDCYLLTNSIRSVGNYDFIKDQRNIPDAQGGGNKFLINENGKFIDYSEKSGIYRSNIGFGLGITLGDFNNDSWTDIFVSNDFFERDYLYINDQHGGFKESLTDYFESISMGSMGADFADLDNDGNPELFVTEMLPDSLKRKKTKTVFESWDKYQLDIQQGYHRQFSRNVLHKKLSSGNYVEVGRISGMAASEWSWGALLFDMNNDGNKDVFIANGIYKDLLDRDFLTYTGSEDNIRKMINRKEDVISKLIDLMPSSPVPNYAFRNDGNLNFTNVAQEWGLGDPMFSCGSAYADLDNDGDLDLVVNNINSPSVVYRNNSDSSKYKSIDIQFSSNGKNTFEVGTGVTVYCGAKSFFVDNFVTRGFQSSVQPGIHIGLGENTTTIDSIVIRWPENGYSVLRNMAVNQTLHIDKENSDINFKPQTNSNSGNTGLLTKYSGNSLFKHKGSGLIDFNRDRLLPMMYSNETPFIVKGDVDGDGQEDIYVGGGKDQASTLIKYESGKFKTHTIDVINKYSLSEETKGALFDADGDGDLDLYMACGGRFFPNTSSALIDRLFINNGKGEFTELPNALPFTSFISTSFVLPFDFDNDGDLDLLVGERFNAYSYGVGGRGYLFENDGKGTFKDVTNDRASELSAIGMTTDACHVDINNDGWMDVVVVGDWMPVVVFMNDHGKLSRAPDALGMSQSEGWWHRIVTDDLNKDGKPDFVIANHGLNTFFKKGDRMYVGDFDGNGSTEQLFCTHVDGRYYPIVDKDELLSQLPTLKKNLLYYKDYGKKSIDELFPETVLAKAKIFQVNILSSVVVLSGANGYHRMELPLEAQFSPLYALRLTDVDGDGIEDLLAGGNQYEVKPQFGRYDASNGWFFKGLLNNGQFSFERGKDLNVKGQIRDIEALKIKEEKYILFTKYDDDLEIYTTRH